MRIYILLGLLSSLVGTGCASLEVRKLIEVEELAKAAQPSPILMESFVSCVVETKDAPVCLSALGLVAGQLSATAKAVADALNNQDKKSSWSSPPSYLYYEGGYYSGHQHHRGCGHHRRHGGGDPALPYMVR